MRPLFGRAHPEVLRRLARGCALIALDYDGTLAPIAADRDAVRMRRETTALLRAVADRYPTAVVSGRSRRDVAARLRGVPLRHVIGNHGIEPSAKARLARFERAAGQAYVLLDQQLARWPGVELEDKRYSLAIHYRRASRKRPARAAIRAAVDALPMDVRVVPGKRVVNVVPSGAPNKGDAVLRARDHDAADAVLYIGDDITDEDVFALDQQGQLITVRVGRAAASAASYFIRDQREIDRVLAELVRLRRP